MLCRFVFLLAKEILTTDGKTLNRIQTLNKNKNVERKGARSASLSSSIELEPSRPPPQYGTAGVTVGRRVGAAPRSRAPEHESAASAFRARRRCCRNRGRVCRTSGQESGFRGGGGRPRCRGMCSYRVVLFRTAFCIASGCSYRVVLLARPTVT